MSLTKILKEFGNTDVPKNFVAKVNDFDGIDDISLLDDYPIGENSAEAFVYLVENKKGKKFVLRITKLPYSDDEDKFKQFVDKSYENIVKVHFSKSLSDRSVTVMEYLPKGINNGSIQDECIDKLFALQYNARVDLKSILVNVDYSTFFFDTKIEHPTKASEQTELRKDLFELYEGSTEARHFIDDVINGLKEYKEQTGNIYLDLHSNNVRGTKLGVYKLIDL